MKSDAPEDRLAERQHRYRLDDQIGFVLRKASQRHINIFARYISDLTPPQFAALAKLNEVGPTSQNQLGALIAMDAATIKGVIDRLKGRGLVELTKDAGDKRRLTVSLTGKGQNAIDALIPVALQITAETLGPLNARETATLLRLLSKMA